MITGTIHAGRVADSIRLTRLRDYLARPDRIGGATTMQLQVALDMCAVSAAVSELRANGYRIECEYEGRNDQGRKVYRYRLLG